MIYSVLTKRENSDLEALVLQLKTVLDEGKARALAAIEQEKKKTYWDVGRYIKTYLLGFEDRAEYGRYVFKRLAEDLHLDKSLLYRSVQFYEAYPQIVVAPQQLSWSHISALLSVSERKSRKKFEQQAIKEKLTTRELRDIIKEATLHTTKGLKKVEYTGKENPQLTQTREEPYVYRVKMMRGLAHLDLGFHTYKENPPMNLKTKEVTHYTYKAFLVEIIDGDTLWVDIELGFDLKSRQKVRLRGIDSPESGSPEGLEAKSFLEKELEGLPFLVVRTYWADKFSRYLVDIFYGDKQEAFLEVVREGCFLNQLLLDVGLAKIYRKKKRGH